MDGFENGTFVTNIAGRSQTQTADETSAHVGENVAVEVWHDKNLVVVGNRIRDHLQASVVEELGVEFDIRIVLAYFSCGAEEKTVGHLHDGSLMHSADLLPPDFLSMLECKSQHSLRCFSSDELYALDNAIHNHVLDPGVFTLGILANENGVDVGVWSVVSGNGLAGSDVGEQVEGTAEGQVQRDMAFPDRCLKEFSSGISLKK